MPSKNKNILILGGESFIAKHFIKNFKESNLIILEKNKISKIIYTKILKIIINKKIDLVVNFISDNNNSINNFNFIESFNSNIFYNLILMEILINENLNFKLLFFSSFEANYKSSLYGINKAYIQNILEILPSRKKNNIKIIKLNSVFGPGDKKITRIIPSLILSIITKGTFQSNIEFKYLIRVDHLIFKLKKFLDSDKNKLTVKGSKYYIKSIVKKIKYFESNKNKKFDNDFLYLTYQWYKNNLINLTNSSKF